MNHSVAIRNMIEIQTAFDGKAFLLYGSALGAVREGKIIEHDKDTDMGVFEKDFNLLAISDLCSKGFQLGHIFGLRHYGMEFALNRDGVKTDLWIMYESPDHFWNSLWDNKRSYDKAEIDNAIVHVYAKDVLALNKVSFCGHQFLSPGEKYAEAVYGPDWRIPKVEFNWRTDHVCTKK